MGRLVVYLVWYAYVELSFREKGGGGGVLGIMLGRSRMTTDPRIPTAGTEHIGFSPIRKASLTPSVKRRDEVWGVMSVVENLVHDFCLN